MVQDHHRKGWRKKVWLKSFNTESGYKATPLLEHLQRGGFPTTSWSKNNINMATCQAAMDDEVFDELCFVNEIGTKPLLQRGEEVRTKRLQDTGAVIHELGSH